ncbi:MAG: YciI family protein [Myxococcota bacterium]
MPKFMLLMLEDPHSEYPEGEPQEMMQKMGKFAGELAQKGQMVEGSPLETIRDAARVRLEGETRHVTDGPFAETKEMISGYFVIEAADRNEAIEIAKRVPALEVGAVEVRQIMEVGGPPA